jgi:CHAT domain-containing protein
MPRLVGVANPDGTLIFSDIEMRQVAHLFGASQTVRHGATATKTWLLENAPNADFLGLSTHAAFFPGRPGSSFFLMAASETDPPQIPVGPQRRDDSLSLEDIWRGELTLEGGAVVVADACETGLIEPSDSVEEHVGFPAAFLANGARTVVASLWSVNDLSTAILMEIFYTRLLARETPSRALQTAIRTVRIMSRPQAVFWLEKRLAETNNDLRVQPSNEVRLNAFKSVVTSTDKNLDRSAKAIVESLRHLRRGPWKPFAEPIHWAPFTIYGS